MHSFIQLGHFCLETLAKVEGRAWSHLPGLYGQLPILFTAVVESWDDREG